MRIVVDAQLSFMIDLKYDLHSGPDLMNFFGVLFCVGKIAFTCDTEYIFHLIRTSGLDQRFAGSCGGEMVMCPSSRKCIAWLSITAEPSRFRVAQPGKFRRIRKFTVPIETRNFT